MKKSRQLELIISMINDKIYHYENTNNQPAVAELEELKKEIYKLLA